jgi:hypothetical protein
VNRHKENWWEFFVLFLSATTAALSAFFEQRAMSYLDEELNGPELP